MTKISAGSVLVYKYLFPVVWFGSVGVFLVLAVVHGAYKKDLVFLIAPCFMAAVGFFIMKQYILDLVDEVYDCGDCLLVKNRGEEEMVPFSNIINVDASTNVNPPRITIKLVQPGRFGEYIAFMPTFARTNNSFAKNKVAEDLMARVDQARLKRSR